MRHSNVYLLDRLQGLGCRRRRSVLTASVPVEEVSSPSRVSKAPSQTAITLSFHLAGFCRQSTSLLTGEV